MVFRINPQKTLATNGVLFILLIVISSVGFAQEKSLNERLSELEDRVQKLESENQKLRGVFSVLKYVNTARQGQPVEIKNDQQVLARLWVAKEGWGESQLADVAAVSKSVAQTLFSEIRPQDCPAIMVVRSDQGPRTLFNRGPNGEYVVFLNTGNRLWAQLAYQLSHELGHVLCREINDQAPQHWLEESYCEALSIWTLERMAVSWQTAPPYGNWTPYAKNLASYVKSIRDRVDRPTNLGEWYATHRALLDDEGYDRPKNRIIADHLANRGKARPDYLRAFLYLHSGKPTANRIESVLSSWRSSCPAKLRFVPEDLARLLNVVIDSADRNR
jgi:hypothetical protein